MDVGRPVPLAPDPSSQPQVPPGHVPSESAAAMFVRRNSKGTGVHEEPGSLPLPIVHWDELIMGARLGGRALREWHAAKLYGTNVIVSRQKAYDNPPASMRQASLGAYAQLHHPNIVTLLGVTTNGEVITEVCEHDLIPTPETKPGNIVPGLLKNLAYARDIARALAWAHHMGVIHRDVKPSHWLVKGGNAKLGGWMFAEVQKGDIHPKPDGRFHGTPLYMAPELWGNEPFEGKKADVYSFGITLWEVVNNKYAFPQYTSLETFGEAVVDRMERPELLNSIPAAVNELISRCWEQSYRKRPPMIEVIECLDKIITARSAGDK